MPDDFTYCDVLDADPAPRELGVAAERYVRRSSSYIWVGLLLAFVLAPAVMAALALPRLATIGTACAVAVAAVVLAKLTADKRAALRRIAIDGRQVPARILDAYELTVRRGLAQGTRTTLVLEVEGRRHTVVSWSGDLEGATRGFWIRVLVHRDVPGVIVPVISVT